jgi:hypothetical protein
MRESRRQIAPASKVMAPANPAYMAKRTRLGLPQEIVQIILEFICNEFEPNGLYILPIVTAELVQIALCCRDFNAALPHCYKHLATKFRLTSSLPESIDWDEFIRNPSKFKVTELKEALMKLTKPTDGLKRGENREIKRCQTQSLDLIHRLLEHFDLNQPRDIPSKLAIYAKLFKRRVIPADMYKKYCIIVKHGNKYTSIEQKTKYVDFCKLVAKHFKGMKEFNKATPKPISIQRITSIRWNSSRSGYGIT